MKQKILHWVKTWDNALRWQCSQWGSLPQLSPLWALTLGGSSLGHYSTQKLGWFTKVYPNAITYSKGRRGCEAFSIHPSVPSSIHMSVIHLVQLKVFSDSPSSYCCSSNLLILQSTEATSSIPLSQMLHLFFPLHHLNGCPKHVAQSKHYWDVAPRFFVALLCCSCTKLQAAACGKWCIPCRVCERDTLFPIVKLQADHDLVAKGGSINKKKQFVALVAKGISKFVWCFLPLFNKGLFPNKTPSATMANRMLFTDVKDEWGSILAIYP